MYNVHRTATIKHAALMPKVIGHSKEVQDYINKEYAGFNLTLSVEMYGKPKMHWNWEADSMAKLEEGNMKLMQDQKYWAMIEQGKDFWLDGSMKDTITMTID